MRRQCLNRSHHQPCHCSRCRRKPEIASAAKAIQEQMFGLSVVQLHTYTSKAEITMFSSDAALPLRLLGLPALATQMRCLHLV